MFIKQRRNKSGSISVQILKKSSGKQKELVETVGCSKDSEELKKLVSKAKSRISELTPQLSLDILDTSKDRLIFEYFQSSSPLSVSAVGPELMLGKIFNSIGFNKIKDELFKDIVLARLVYPVSKLRTSEYLLQHKAKVIDVSEIYRFLDKLNSEYKQEIEQIAYEYTKGVLGEISVVFYDMTTLYFEAEQEDDLRKIGFSKDGKFQNPQIMIGLLVGENGYPIGYDIFEGNTFEGHTLIPVINKMQNKYGFDKPIIIADSALLSKANIEQLIEKDYKFILGGRIKNESKELKKKIINQTKNISDGENIVIDKSDLTRLVVSYSKKRAYKDSKNREKGLKRLRDKIKNGRLNKQNINNRGYNKFLTLEGEVKITVDEQKAKNEEQWDGLKGYITNSSLPADKIIKNYHQLWQIEKAFRISKTDLRIRPIFHRKKNRIEAHICIAFVAYTVFKELERLLTDKKINLSAQKAIELSKTIYQIEFVLPDSKKIHSTILFKATEQRELMQILN